MDEKYEEYDVGAGLRKSEHRRDLEEFEPR